MTFPAAARLPGPRWGLVALLLLLAVQAGLGGRLTTAPAPEAVGLDQVAAFNRGQLCGFGGGDPHPRHRAVAHEHCLVCFAHPVAVAPAEHRPARFARFSSVAPAAYAFAAPPPAVTPVAPRAPPAPA
jgi:hypothetical protein